MLRKLSKWADLDEDDQRAVLALPHEKRSIRKGNYIVREGEKPTRSCVLLSGFAYRHKVVGNGGRQILSVHMSGDMVDLQKSFLSIADHDVQALTDSIVAFIPADVLQELAFNRPAVGIALWRDTLVDGAVHREWTANVGRRDARTRMAHLLCEFGVRLQDAGLGELCSYEIPMTQEQLADCTGLTPVHVNRTLKALDREGLTERTLRSVSISNWATLAHAGDFDARYLHLENKQSLG
jgi:CRP-like cAMP-binding protein